MMRTLNSLETSQVSGGNDTVVFIALGVAGASLLLSFCAIDYVTQQADLINELYILTINQEAQLKLLPGYTETSNLSFDEVWNSLTITS